MINGISLNTNEVGFEQIYVTGLLEGGQENVESLIVRDNLNAGQQTVYDDFVALIEDKMSLTIDNTLCAMSIDRITSVAITEDAVDLDYATLGANQAKVDAFCQLVADLTA